MIELFQSIFTTDSNHHLPDTRKRAKRPIPPLCITVDGVKNYSLVLTRTKLNLPNFVKSTVWLFADDYLLYRQIKSREDHISLQHDIYRQGQRHGEMNFKCVSMQKMLHHEHQLQVRAFLPAGWPQSTAVSRKPIPWCNHIRRLEVEFTHQ